MTPLNNKARNSVRILTVDPSGSHLAYTISSLDQFTSTQIIEDAGIIWVSDAWSRGQKFSYMRKCLEFLIQTADITSVVTEAFFVSPKLKVGTSVIPTINNLMQMIIYETGREILYEEVSPTSWRHKLSIKPVKDSKGKRDYKQPTKDRVEQLLKISFPETVISNITSQPRDFPTDIPDAMAITIYISYEYNIKKLAVSPTMSYTRYSKNLKELK
jgi:hypothetical protein